MPAAALLLFALALQAAPAPCADAKECREAALAAAAREDYEAFHDLAWRAAQKSGLNNPEAMQLLARAQSLSGRPGDALVMLRRLAQLGIASEARTSDDFRRVRALPGWPEVEASLAAASAATPRPLPPASAPPAVSVVPPAKSSAPPAVAAPPRALRSPARPVTPEAAPLSVPSGEETMRLTPGALDPVGLAYDGTSRRFVLGDRRGNKLIVADEVFNHVNDLIGAASAGFGTLSGLDIDGRRGDLWVASNDGSGGATLHRLQLVSGRVLTRLEVPASLKPVEITDVVLTGGGAVLLLDSLGGRLIRLLPSEREFAAPLKLDLPGAASVAPAGDGAYVAYRDGLARVNTTTGRVSLLEGSSEANVGELRRIRWGGSALFGIQDLGNARQVVRIQLGRGGRTVTAVQPVDSGSRSAGAALTISRDAAYYVSERADGPAIRRVPLK